MSMPVSRRTGIILLAGLGVEMLAACRANTLPAPKPTRDQLQAIDTTPSVNLDFLTKTRSGFIGGLVRPNGEQTSLVAIDRNHLATSGVIENLSIRYGVSRLEVAVTGLPQERINVLFNLLAVADDKFLDEAAKTLSIKGYPGSFLVIEARHTPTRFTQEPFVHPARLSYTSK